MHSNVLPYALRTKELNAVSAHVSDKFLGMDGAMVCDEVLLGVDFVEVVGGEEGAGGARMREGVVVGGLVFFMEEVHVVHWDGI